MDDLLKRADQVIRESRLIRDQAHKDREDARMALERARATLRLARMEGERAVNLCREKTSQVVLSAPDDR